MEVEAPVSAQSKNNGKTIGNNGAATTRYLSPKEAETKRRRRRNCRFVCLGLILAILAIAILAVVLAFTVFKPKHPVANVNSISLKDLNFSVDILKLQIHINISLDVNLSLKNPNKVGFKYTNSTTYLEYRGKVIGEVPIPSGKISAGKTADMNVTLTLLADRLMLSDTQLYTDVISKNMPLSTHTRISGKVHILFFKIKVISNTDCDLAVNVFNRSVTNMDCRYKTKI